MLRRRVVDGTEALETARAGCEHDTPARGLFAQPVEREGGGVHDAAQVDVQCEVVGFQEVAGVVELFGQVVGAAGDAGVGEDVVDAAVGGDGELEEGGEVGPGGDVGGLEGYFWVRDGHGVEVAGDDMCAEREEEFGCAKSDS